jgi:hypothetical protein
VKVVLLVGSMYETLVKLPKIYCILSERSNVGFDVFKDAMAKGQAGELIFVAATQYDANSESI